MSVDPGAQEIVIDKDVDNTVVSSLLKVAEEERSKYRCEKERSSKLLVQVGEFRSFLKTKEGEIQSLRGKVDAGRTALETDRRKWEERENKLKESAAQLRRERDMMAGRERAQAAEIRRLKLKVKRLTEAGQDAAAFGTSKVDVGVKLTGPLLEADDVRGRRDLDIISLLEVKQIELLSENSRLHDELENKRLELELVRRQKADGQESRERPVEDGERVKMLKNIIATQSGVIKRLSKSSVALKSS